MDQSTTWAALYRVGAIAAFVYVAMMLVPLVLMIVAPVPPMGDGAAILDYVNAHRGIYLAELISFVGLCIPAIAMFLALGIALRSASPSFALLGSVLGIASEIAVAKIPIAGLIFLPPCGNPADGILDATQSFRRPAR